MRRKFLAFLLPVILCAAFTFGGTVAYASTDAETVAEAAEMFGLLVGGTKIEKDKDYTAFDYSSYWEPGCVHYERFSMVMGKQGDFSYKLTMELPQGVSLSKLADVMDVYVFDFDSSSVPNRGSVNPNNWIGSVSDIINNGGVLLSGQSNGEEQDETVFDVVVAFKMRESAGNAYQGLKLCDGGFTLKLSATQSVTP